MTAPDAEDMVDAVVSVTTSETLREVLRGPVDVACTGGPRSVAGGYEVNVLTSRSFVSELRRIGIEVTEVSSSRGATTADVGIGDRYQAGRLAPAGFGRERGWIRWLLASATHR